MQDLPSSKDTCVVTREAAAAVLLDAEARRWFIPFFAQTSSVSDAAKVLGEKPNSVLYRVRRWLELGLLQVEREELRRGRQVRYYRSTADAFFVPQRASSTEDFVALLEYTNTPFLETLYRNVVAAVASLSPDWGVQFSRTDAGICIVAASEPGTILDPSPQDSPAVFGQFTRLRLDFEDAKTFQRELSELLDRYTHKEGGQAYLSYLALAPLS